MTLYSLLISMGVNIGSNAFYDILKLFFQKTSNPTLDKFKTELQKHIVVENAKIEHERIIRFLVENGDITISGSNIYAKKTIYFQSSKGSAFQIKNGSSSRTDQSSIEVGIGGSIIGADGAAIQQGEDGITFQT